MSAIGLDNDTILQFNKGDESAFTVIYNHFYHHIFCFLQVPAAYRRRCKGYDGATFYPVMGKKETLHSYTHLRAFLFLNARNKCFNFLRDQKARSAIDKQLGDFTIEEQRAILFSEIESELIARLYEEVEKLPDYYKNILKLSYFQGYSNQEIAAMLNISEKTVRNAKSIALKTVKIVFLNRNTKMGITLSFCYFF